MAKLLNDSLVTITDDYRSRGIYQKHLRPSEVSRLVKAIFEDNPKRRALLELVQKEHV